MKYELYHGECVAVMEKLAKEGIKVDAVICDPPYGVFGSNKDSKELCWDNIIEFDEMWEKINKLLKRQNANVILFGDDNFTHKLRNSNEQGYRYQIIWNKLTAGLGLYAKHQPLKQIEYISVFGNPFNYDNNIKKYHYDLYLSSGKTKKELASLFGVCHTSNHFLEANGNGKCLKKLNEKEYGILLGLIGNGFETMTYEEYLSFWKPPTYNPQMTKREKPSRNGRGGGYLNEDKLNIKLKNNSNEIRTENYPTNIIDFKKVTSNAEHPTQKPVELMEYLVKTYTNEGDVVLDFTMGSGTTGVACKNTKRNFIGIELDEKYFEIAKRRMETN